MSTTTREECITTINEFLRTHSYQSALIMLNHYLEEKDDNYRAQTMQIIQQNPDMLNICMPKVLKELEIKNSLIEVSKNNQPILVY